MINVYGFNEIGILTHINDVVEKNSRKYFCIQCNDELIARKGEINRHHFSHKNKVICNYETYLHKLGKIKFFNLYNNCLENNIPFYTNYEIIKTCTSCNSIENHNFNCYLNNEKGKKDLTEFFDQVLLERNHDGFIADVLLKSSHREEVIFIEIYVTHPCDNKKVKSGNRIIEIKIENEEDLDFLNERFIHQNIDNCKFYNFKVPTIKKNFIQIHECLNEIRLFTIFKSGKVIIREVVRKDLNKVLQNPNAIYNKILNQNEKGNGYYNDLISNIEEAARKGVKFKNCYACRFWAKNPHRLITGEDIFCKRKKILIEKSNNGHDCDKFWRIE